LYFFPPAKYRPAQFSSVTRCIATLVLLQHLEFSLGIAQRLGVEIAEE
jgi:hypothetical protein